ncbi:T9SS type A sorting domain-containing protein [Paraflavitalea speifideaquila]|uniref:T9SS type A sorting domain-containing protein n=1 Tax=Paraflavitalea speifideaquila TaxID=3076558 RepID=UPI003312FFAE
METDQYLAGSLLYVYDANGQLMQQEVLRSNYYTLKMNTASSGIYLIKIVSAKTRETFLHRILYQR